nr:hypothetical protein [Cytophagales bacterium]
MLFTVLHKRIKEAEDHHEGNISARNLFSYVSLEKFLLHSEAYSKGPSIQVNRTVPLGLGNSIEFQYKNPKKIN